MLDALMATDWVVNAKPCLGHTESVLASLARYTHRTALTDPRLIGIEGERVGLRYTGHRDGERKALWLEATELIRRFLLHVLPKGLMRIRHYGFLANRCRAERLRQVRDALARDGDAREEARRSDAPHCEACAPVPDALRCPHCLLGWLRMQRRCADAASRGRVTTCAEPPLLPRRHHALRCGLRTGGVCARCALERIGYTLLSGR